jgi:hypothetical protein
LVSRWLCDGRAVDMVDAANMSHARRILVSREMSRSLTELMTGPRHYF